MQRHRAHLAHARRYAAGTMSSFLWIQPFLAALASGCTVSEAAQAAGITSGVAYARRKHDADFSEAWAQALEDSTDILEREARRRAIDGVAEPVVYQGRLSYVTERVVDEDGTETFQPVIALDGQPVPLTIRKPSDSLLALLLKGRRKEFATERTELTGKDGTPVVIDSTTRAARVAALLQVAKARSDIA